MARIFSSTTRPLGWLGVGNEETHTAIGITNELASTALRFGIDSSKTMNWDFLTRHSGEVIRQLLRDLAVRLDYRALGVSSTKLGFHASGLYKKPPSHLN